MKKALIIGAGLSGLSAAYALQRRGWQVRLLERASSIGGALRTVREDGFQFEWGANSFLLNDSRVESFLDGVGLLERCIESGREGKKRFLVRHGEILPVPMSPWQAIATPLFPLSAKLRLLAEPLQAIGYSGESVSSFIRRRLGPEILDQAVQPLISGIYAGDPARLVMDRAFPVLAELEQQYGSLLWGMIRRGKSPHKARRRLVSWPKGMQELVDGLAAGLQDAPQLDAQLMDLKVGAGGGWDAAWQVGEETKSEIHKEHFDVVISTVPINKIQNLPVFSELQKSSENIPYAPVTALGLGFKLEDVGHPLDGFGVLIPEREKLPVLGALFSSTLFPDRAPDGHVLLTVFLGGRLHPERAEGAMGALVKRAMLGLKGLLDIKAGPVWSTAKYWQRAIPQYEEGHASAIHNINAFEKTHPGLYVTGNFRGGISVPQCILAALTLTEILD